MKIIKIKKKPRIIESVKYLNICSIREVLQDTKLPVDITIPLIAKKDKLKIIKGFIKFNKDITNSIFLGSLLEI